MSILPRPARLLDAAAIVLLVAAFVVELTGGLSTRVLGVRLSITSVPRLLGWAVLLIAVRHIWVRRPPIWAPLTRWIEAGRLDYAAVDPQAPGPWRRRLALHAVVVAGFVALTSLVAFQQIAQPRGLADLGDPLFSVWRLDWVAFQVLRDPAHLFDANIFHPARGTLAYSDAMLLQAALAAPWIWLGADPVIVHNVLMLAASAFSGVTMFWLVRALTRSTSAAAVGGAMFALLPVRWALYSHLELQSMVWVPLALLYAHRTVATGRLRDGLLAGFAVAMQVLSCLYYSLFLAVFAAVVIPLFAMFTRARTRRAVVALGAGGVLAAALVAPVAVPYLRNRATVGERVLEMAAPFSAEPRDYLVAAHRSRLYDGRLLEPKNHLGLFPGVTASALTLAGLWTPAPAALAYGAGFLLAADASLGVNGTAYPAMFKLLLPFRGLRAPNRFAVIVGASLSVLAGFGVARILRRVRSPAGRTAIAAVLVAIVALESAPSLILTDAWPEAPSIYRHLPPGPDVVLADLPFPQRDGSFEIEYSYLQFATAHHRRLVNGGSGFYPPWYNGLAELMRSFPDDASIEALRRQGARFVVLHGAFFDAGQYAAAIAALDRRPDVRLVAAEPWNGAESCLYDLSPARAPH